MCVVREKYTACQRGHVEKLCSVCQCASVWKSVEFLQNGQIPTDSIQAVLEPAPLMEKYTAYQMVMSKYVYDALNQVRHGGYSAKPDLYLLLTNRLSIHLIRWSYGQSIQQIRW